MEGMGGSRDRGPDTAVRLGTRCLSRPMARKTLNTLHTLHSLFSFSSEQNENKWMGGALVNGGYGRFEGPEGPEAGARLQ